MHSEEGRDLLDHADAQLAIRLPLCSSHNQPSRMTSQMPCHLTTQVLMAMQFDRSMHRPNVVGGGQVAISLAADLETGSDILSSGLPEAEY